MTIVLDGSIGITANIIDAVEVQANDVAAVTSLKLGGDNVVERGSNANGEYVKFADGTMICTVLPQLTYTNISTLTYLWTYPVAFVEAIPAILVTPRQTPAAGQRSALTYGNTSGLTSTVLTIIHDAAPYVAGNTLNVSAIAIGRWK